MPELEVRAAPPCPGAASSGDGDASAAALQSHHNVLVAMGTRRKEGRETLGDQND